MIRSTIINFFILVAMLSAKSTANLTKHPNWNLIDHENCGESITDRIIGGKVAGMGQFPWMARLGYCRFIKNIFESEFVEFRCGASLISKIYVVTAAHCVTEVGEYLLKLVRLGEYDVRTTVDCYNDICAPPPQDFAPGEVIFHENFQNPKMRNDIALIRLDRPAIFNDYVSTICLPRGSLLSKNYEGQKMEVAGWGVNDIKMKSVSSLPMVVKLRVIPPERCEAGLGHYAHMGKGQLCAGDTRGKDSCGGDSGGPMMTVQVVDNKPPKYFLAAVVSYGSRHCGNSAPAVYSDVATFMPWILDHLKP